MTKVNHDLRVNNGGTIYHLPEVAGQPHQGNLEIPNIFEETELQLYPLGTRLVLGDRVYRYFCAGGAIPRTSTAIVSNTSMLVEDADVYGAHLAGAATLTIDQISGASDGDPAANFFAGGLAYIHSGVLIGTKLWRPTMGVTSSLKAAADSPYEVVLTLEQPLPCAFADGTTVEILPSLYASCVTCFGDVLNAMYYPVVGMAAVPMTSAYYGWVQTWGPCPITNTNTVMGEVSGDRTAAFWSDASIRPLDEIVHEAPGPFSPQIAGYCLRAGGTGTMAWTYLMIAP